MRQRWAGSIGNPDADILSIPSSTCQWGGSDIGTYADALQASNNEVLRWFNGYLNCFRPGELLAGEITGFDTAESQITSYIREAIQHQINGAQNPVPGAEYVKNTSSCFVWHRDESGGKTGCRGADGKIDMLSFCNEAPVGRAIPENDRSCRSSSMNIDNIDVGKWLNSEEGRNSNQQLDLSTKVGINYRINLGLYTPDLPSPGCPNSCFFLLGNPGENPARIGIIYGETKETAWPRHEARFLNQAFGYKPDASSYYIHVLRKEGEEPYLYYTWITFVFQTQ